MSEPSRRAAVELLLRAALKRIAIVFVLLAVPSLAHAQSPAESYRLNLFNAGAPKPLTVSDLFPASAVSCNQQPLTTIDTVNPNTVFWNDPINQGRICIWAAPPTASLLALPTPGSYEASLTAINAGGSRESIRTPFSRVGEPAIPTGFGVSR